MYLTVITFPEHVRKEITNDLRSLIDENEAARKKYPRLKIWTGCEARVLPNGELDCSVEVLELSDYIFFSFNSFSYDKKIYLSPLC